MLLLRKFSFYSLFNLSCLRSSIFVMGILFSTFSFAFGSNNNAPIKIQSDSAVLNNQKGIATYTGNVIITQADATMNADKVIIYSNKNILTKIEAFGRPAHFIQKANLKTPETKASGETIVFNNQKQILTLTNKAHLQQGQNSFTGSVIEYNTLKGIINAHSNKNLSPSTPGSRVEIEFHPVKSTQKEKQ